LKVNSFLFIANIYYENTEQLLCFQNKYFEYIFENIGDVFSEIKHFDIFQSVRIGLKQILERIF